MRRKCGPAAPPATRPLLLALLLAAFHPGPPFARQPHADAAPADDDPIGGDPFARHHHHHGGAAGAGAAGAGAAAAAADDGDAACNHMSENERHECLKRQIKQSVQDLADSTLLDRMLSHASAALTSWYHILTLYILARSTWYNQHGRRSQRLLRRGFDLRRMWRLRWSVFRRGGAVLRGADGNSLTNVYFKDYLTWTTIMPSFLGAVAIWYWSTAAGSRSGFGSQLVLAVLSVGILTPLCWCSLILIVRGDATFMISKSSTAAAMAVASGAGGTGQASGARGSSASQSAAGPGAGADDADRPFNDLQDIAADLLTQLRPMYVWGNHDMAPYAPWNNSEVGSSSAKVNMVDAGHQTQQLRSQSQQQQQQQQQTAEDGMRLRSATLGSGRVMVRQFSDEPPEGGNGIRSRLAPSVSLRQPSGGHPIQALQLPSLTPSARHLVRRQSPWVPTKKGQELYAKPWWGRWRTLNSPSENRRMGVLRNDESVMYRLVRHEVTRIDWPVDTGNDTTTTGASSGVLQIDGRDLLPPQEAARLVHEIAHRSHPITVLRENHRTRATKRARSAGGSLLSQVSIRTEVGQAQYARDVRRAMINLGNAFRILAQEDEEEEEEDDEGGRQRSTGRRRGSSYSEGARRLGRSYTKESVAAQGQTVNEGPVLREGSTAGVEDTLHLEVIVTYNFVPPAGKVAGAGGTLRRQMFEGSAVRPSHIKLQLFSRRGRSSGAPSSNNDLSSTEGKSGHTCSDSEDDDDGGGIGGGGVGGGGGDDNVGISGIHGGGDTLYLRAEVWRDTGLGEMDERDGRAKPKKERAIRRKGLAEHVCWTAWKMAHRNRTAIAVSDRTVEYFNRVCLEDRRHRRGSNSFRWRCLAELEHRHSGGVGSRNWPEVEAAPFRRFFLGKWTGISRRGNGGAAEYYEVEFRDGVLDGLVFYVHRSRLIKSRRKFCHYRRIQSNYYWDRPGMDDSASSNRHYCFGAPPPRELGGPKKSRLETKLEKFKQERRWVRRSILRTTSSAVYSPACMSRCPDCREWFCRSHLQSHRLDSDKGCNVPEVVKRRVLCVQVPTDSTNV